MQIKKPNEPERSEERIKINTGSSTYSFTEDWTKNEALRDILSGLVAEDLNRNFGNGDKL